MQNIQDLQANDVINHQRWFHSQRSEYQGENVPYPVVNIQATKEYSTPTCHRNDCGNTVTNCDFDVWI